MMMSQNSSSPPINSNQQSPQKRSKRFYFEDSIYMLHPTRRNSPFKYDIIFVHGLLGTVFRTWRQASWEVNSPEYTTCWPRDWMGKDLEHARILGVNYPTFLSEWRIQCPVKITLESRAEYILDKLMKADVGSRPIIWVCHSMGGLLVKQLLSTADSKSSTRKIATNTRGLVFYSVPHRGSNMAKLSDRTKAMLLPSTEVIELERGSPVLAEIHEKFLTLVNKYAIDCISFGEKLPSHIGTARFKMTTHLVTKDSADPGMGEFYELETNHFNICKPDCRTAPNYQLVLDFIKRKLFAATENKPLDRDANELMTVFSAY